MNLYEIIDLTTGELYSVVTHITDWSNEGLIESFRENAIRRQKANLPISRFASRLLLMNGTKPAFYVKRRTVLDDPSIRKPCISLREAQRIYFSKFRPNEASVAEHK